MTTDRRRIVMVGPRIDARGGIAAVARVLMSSRLAQDYTLEYVGTSGDGGALARAAQSALGVIRAAASIARSPEALLHLHVASRASFWRKWFIGCVAALLHRPVVVHLHGGLFHEFAGGGGGARTAAVSRLFEGANAVILLSDSWAERAQHFAPGANIVVLPNPVAVPLETSDMDSTRVLFAGRLGVLKGVPDLIRAFSALHDQFPEWHLVLAGDGDVDEATALIRALGLESVVDVLGWASPQDVAVLRQTCSVFCLPSNYEGLPMALLEAMAAGQCCVVTAVGGIPEHVTDGVDGVVLQPRDPDALQAALVAVLSDRSLRKALGAEARAHVTSCCAEDVVISRLEAVYASIGWGPTEEGGDA